MLFKISLDSMRALESLGLDSINALDCESTLNCVLSTFALVDSVIVFESVGLDSVKALDSESTLDSVDSLFLRVVFSRIFSRFSKSLVCAKEKGVSPLPALPSPEKDKAPRFCCALLATRWVFLRNRGECLAVSLSRQNEVSLEKSAVALLPPCS